MKNHFRQIAIIGPTASGKTALGIKIAKEINAKILSLDSLAIYKEIDIASAKPTKEEMDGICHFGIDIIAPNEDFDVTVYANLYKQVVSQCKHENIPLIITGGSSFYLKILINGISKTPKINDEHYKKATEMLHDTHKTYNVLFEKDPIYMSKISHNDRYRIEKALLIYLASSKTPSEYFASNVPEPIIKDPLSIYSIATKRELLREKIKHRTEQMVQHGLIQEVEYLKNKYGTKPNSMKAIGIKETLGYLEGEYTKKELIELISVHTSQLAKRQETFNKTQFQSTKKLLADEIYQDILKA